MTAGNALERVQRVHAPADLWDITFCTLRILTEILIYLKISGFKKIPKDFLKTQTFFSSGKLQQKFLLRCAPMYIELLMLKSILSTSLKESSRSKYYQ